MFQSAQLIFVDMKIKIPHTDIWNHNMNYVMNLQNRQKLGGKKHSFQQIGIRFSPPLMSCWFAPVRTIWGSRYLILDRHNDMIEWKPIFQQPGWFFPTWRHFPEKNIGICVSAMNWTIISTATFRRPWLRHDVHFKWWTSHSCRAVEVTG